MNRVACVSFVLASLVGVVAAVGGPLNPPAGPVTSTYKTLTEVEPRIAINATNTPGNTNASFVITQPGSYYLTGNVQGASGKHGILIAATVDNVTIDLNGFQLLGGAGSLSGIVVQNVAVDAITVRNGTIDAWGQDGIRAIGAGGGRVEGVIAKNNGGVGINAGNDYVVDDCSAFDNAGVGISTGSGCIVTKSVSRGNYIGFAIGIGTIAQDNVATANESDGFTCGSRAVVRNNVAVGNGTAVTNGAGIYVSGNFCRVEGNTMHSADYGLQIISATNTVMRNTCSGNTTNWAISGGNYVAPIVQATNNNGSINGNTYAGNLGSTDPNANFTQ